MFMLSAKSGNAARWSLADRPISRFNLGRCFKYHGGKSLRIARSKRGAYISCTIGLKLAILENVDVEEWVLVVEEEEVELVGEDGEDGGEEWGGEQGGEWNGMEYLLRDLKGVIITNFLTSSSPSIDSNKELE